jgi:hypothetical protein
MGATYGGNLQATRLYVGVLCILVDAQYSVKHLTTAVLNNLRSTLQLTIHASNIKCALTVVYMVAASPDGMQSWSPDFSAC